MSNRKGKLSILLLWHPPFYWKKSNLSINVSLKRNSIEQEENKDDEEEENIEVNTINIKMISDSLTSF